MTPPDTEPTADTEPAERVTLPEPWESITAEHDDDEQLTITVAGKPQPFLSRRELAEHFADPAVQAQQERVQQIAESHHWETVPGRNGMRVHVPNGQTATEYLADSALLK